MFYIFLMTFSLAHLFCCGDQLSAPKEVSYFTNPVVKSGADPWVIGWQGNYYYCFSDNNKIWIAKSETLQDIGRVTPVAVWSAVPKTNYSSELWAPELHYLDGKWYIYVAADNGDNNNHRMYVLEGSTQNPQDSFSLKGKISAPTDKWAIDGTVLQTDENKLYFVWSGWQGDENVRQDIYIAQMTNPWTISSERSLILSPELEWELHGNPLINEGPEILKHNGSIFIIYSASGSWTDYYCLGQLTYNGGDITKKESWTKKASPVFSGTDKVFGPGHASFKKSPDGTEDWVVYHAAKRKGAGWDRNVRIQKFSWNADGSPEFGSPVAEGVRLKAPSEQ